MAIKLSEYLTISAPTGYGGTPSQTFQIDMDASGVVLRNESGVLWIRNAGDSAYASIIANNITSNGNITCSTAPTAGSHVVNKNYVDNLVRSIDWQESVLDRFDPTSGAPSSPITGDRYLSTGNGSGWSTDNIYEYNGSSWNEINVSEGMAVWVEDENLMYNYNGTEWVVFGSGGGGINEIEFSSEDVKMDETNTGVDAGTAFDVFDTLNFDPDTTGSIWFNFNLPTGFDVNTDINFDLVYTLNGSDNGNVVYLNTKVWIVDSGETPVEASPDINQNDSITAATTNTGALAGITLTNAVISETHLSTNTLRISCKLTRDAVNALDTYTGTFQLVSVKVYQ